VGVRLGQRAGFPKGENNYFYRHLMTKVLIANRLYRDLTRKVFVVNHRYRHLITSMVEEHGTGIFCETQILYFAHLADSLARLPGSPGVKGFTLPTMVKLRAIRPT
jgi:hypothetical protein